MTSLWRKWRTKRTAKTALWSVDLPSDPLTRHSFHLLRTKRREVVPFRQHDRIATEDLLKLRERELVAYLKLGGEWEGRRRSIVGANGRTGARPGMEWRHLARLRWMPAPAGFEVVLALDSHDSDFNWFDLVRRS